MAIEVMLGEAKPQDGRPFPKLMIHGESGIITMFREYGIGINIYAPNEVVFAPLWTEYSILMDCYKDYNESITLKNK